MITPTLAKAYNMGNTINNKNYSNETKENTREKHGGDKVIKSPDNRVPKEYKINSSTQADAKDGAYSKLFDTRKIQEVNINISENNFNYMLQNAINKPYVLAKSFSIGDRSISNVGLKISGDSSLKDVWNSDSDRFSFEINTGKYVDKDDYGENQNLYGIERISLDNIYGDSTLMKEFLSYELMSKMGVPTPLYSLVKLNINGEFYGIYNMKETLSVANIKRTMKNTDGELYKCNDPGGSLLYNSSALDSLLNSNGKYKFDIAGYKDKDNVLSSYTGILGNKVYGTSIKNCKGKEDNINKDCNRLFAWIKKLNKLNESKDTNTEKYKDDLEGILNVDEALRYFAVNTYLVNLDSYQGKKPENYSIHLLNGKVTILPGNYNYSFGTYKDFKASDMINFSIDNPVKDTTLKERPLLNVLLKNDDYRAKYKSYLADCTKIASLGGLVNGVNYNKDYISNKIDDYKKFLDDSVKNDTTSFVEHDEFIKSLNDLKSINTQRAKAVSNQVNNNFDEVSAEEMLSSSFESSKPKTSLIGTPSMIAGPKELEKLDNENNSTDSDKSSDTTKSENTDESNKDNEDVQGQADSTEDNEDLNLDNNEGSETNNGNSQNDYTNEDDGKPSYDNNDDKYGGIFKTSDGNRIGIYIIISTLSIIGILFYILKKRR